MGQLRQGSKSDLMECLTKSSQPASIHLGIDVKALDGAAIDDFRGACARSRETSRSRVTSSVSTTEMLSTHDVTLRNVDGSLFHVQI